MGPYELSENLNGISYFKFLDCIILLDVLPLSWSQNMWFLQDSAMPYFTHQVRTYLNQHFPER